ncbi:MAG: AbrB/MazE/SpoVT family DNA-binding domain-containing protein [Rhodocyclaceae bacterium]|nr:AbrB/MazE/SpoVT family DNA-binding domain-containing protein [Rhodocyclaceae bacterium]
MPIQVVRKWGHSSAVRIPASVMQAAHLTPGCVVDVRAEGGRIVIEPQQPAVDLEALLAAIGPHNLPEPIETGAPQGAEAW